MVAFEMKGPFSSREKKLHSGMLTTRASSLSQPVQGPLYYISLRSQDLLVKHIPDFCSLFVNDRQSINTKM